MTGHCTRLISSAHEDEEIYECGRHATVEALTTTGQWEPHCAPHVAGWPSDRVRLPVTADVQRELAAAVRDVATGPEDGPGWDAVAADALLPTVQALIADAEKRAAAAALRDAAAAPLPVGHLNIRAWLNDRAAALDPAGAGDEAAR